ncbi:putative lipoprotein [Selenomonas sp. FOBRC6]|nr:putative lipoprotein [Selenomonas sp. FOBRC6]
MRPIAHRIQPAPSFWSAAASSCPITPQPSDAQRYLTFDIKSPPFRIHST